jgi:hypothetical protein
MRAISDHHPAGSAPRRQTMIWWPQPGNPKSNHKQLEAGSGEWASEIGSGSDGGTEHAGGQARCNNHGASQRVVCRPPAQQWALPARPASSLLITMPGEASAGRCQSPPSILRRPASYHGLLAGFCDGAQILAASHECVWIFSRDLDILSSNKIESKKVLLTPSVSRWINAQYWQPAVYSVLHFSNKKRGPKITKHTNQCEV